MNQILSNRIQVPEKVGRSGVKPLEGREWWEFPGQQRKATQLQKGFHRRNTEEGTAKDCATPEVSLGISKLWHQRAPKSLQPSWNLMPRAAACSPELLWATWAVTGTKWMLPLLLGLRHLAEQEGLSGSGSLAASQVVLIPLSLSFSLHKMEVKNTHLSDLLNRKKMRSYIQNADTFNSAYLIKRSYHYKVT